MSDSSEIVLISSAEAIRRRVHFWIKNLNENALNGFIKGFADSEYYFPDSPSSGYIQITLNSDNSFTYRTFNENFVVEGLKPAKFENISNLERAMTHLSQFAPHGSDYLWQEVIVNSLSDWGFIEIRQAEVIYRQDYRCGVPTAALNTITNSNFPNIFTINNQQVRSNLTVCFHPDPEIFADTTYNFENLAQWGQKLSLVFPGLTLQLLDKRSSAVVEKIFYAPGGLPAYLAALNQAEKLLTPVIFGVASAKLAHENDKLEIFLQFVEPTLANSKDTIELWETNTPISFEGALRRRFYAGLNEALAEIKKKLFPAKSYPKLTKSKLSLKKRLELKTASRTFRLTGFINARLNLGLRLSRQAFEVALQKTIYDILRDWAKQHPSDFLTLLVAK